jgi:hypothetical protein
MSAPRAVWVMVPAGDITARTVSDLAEQLESGNVCAVGADINDILSASKALRGSQPTQNLMPNYWNVFADGDVASATETTAYLQWSDELTRALNSRICTAAHGAGAICVDLYAALKSNGSQHPTTLLARRRRPSQRRWLWAHHLGLVVCDATKHVILGHSRQP